MWATEALRGADLAAPGLLPFECSNIIRRHELAGLVSPDQAAQAHADLVALPVELWPYVVLGPRVWELRRDLSSYDAASVAVAELVESDLVTLDRRLGRVPKLSCRVLTPDQLA